MVSMLLWYQKPTIIQQISEKVYFLRNVSTSMRQKRTLLKEQNTKVVFDCTYIKGKLQRSHVFFF